MCFYLAYKNYIDDMTLDSLSKTYLFYHLDVASVRTEKEIKTTSLDIGIT